MKESNKEESSFWSVMLHTAGFLAGVFLAYKVISEKIKEETPKDKKETGKTGKIEEQEQRKVVDDRVKNTLPINQRQSKILAELKRKKKMMPSEIYKLEPNVSTRTLRRDMDVLVAQKVVRQEGSTKSTKYTYIG